MCSCSEYGGGHEKVERESMRRVIGTTQHVVAQTLLARAPKAVQVRQRYARVRVHQRAQAQTQALKRNSGMSTPSSRK